MRYDTVKAAAIGAGLLALGILGSSSDAYYDFPGFGDETSGGRTRNAVATLVAGTLAQEMYQGNAQTATIDLEVGKTLYSNSRIIGRKTPTSIQTSMDLAFAHSQLEATVTGGTLRGQVHKSEFDWGINQTGPDTYKVGRFGLKFDTTLRMTAKDGKISGVYDHPLQYNWEISGSYDKSGNVHVRIDVPFSPYDITLDGKIAEVNK